MENENLGSEWVCEKGTLTLLAEHARKRPHNTSLLWLDEKGSETVRLSFLELYQSSLAVASLLRDDLGLKRGDRVLLVFSPGLEFCPAFLGCLLAGVIASPIYPPDPRNPVRGMKKLNAVVEVAKPKIALMDPLFRSAKRLQQLSRKGPKYPEGLVFETVDLKRLLVHGQKQPHPSTAELLSRDFSDDTAFVQYTSGSTGMPKGVNITFSALSHNIHNMLWTIGLVKVDHDAVVGCGWAPYYHDMGLVASFLNFACAGLKHVAFSPISFIKDPLLWIETMAKYNVRHTIAPNFAYELVVRRHQSNPSRLLNQHKEGKLDLSLSKRWVICAEPVSKSTLDKFVQCFDFAGVRPEYLCPYYGLAENVVLVSGHHGPPCPFSAVKVKANSLVAGNKIEVVTEETSSSVVELVGNGTANFLIRVSVAVNGEVVDEEGIVGELTISGPCLASGYFENITATEQAFRQIPQLGRSYCSGDMGFLWKKQVYVCGRIKDMLIVNGVNFYAQDFEQAAFESNPKLQRGGCQAAYQDSNAEVVILSELRSTKLSPEALRDQAIAIRNAIASVNGLLAHRVCLTGPKVLPKTTSGKIRRKESRVLHEKNCLEILFELSVPKQNKNQMPIPDLLSDDAVVWLSGRIAEILQLDSNEISSETKLESAGLTSMQYVALTRALEDISKCTDLP